MKNILYTIILSFLFSFSVFADWEAGVDALEKGDYETAYIEFITFAERGNVDAQYNLGLMYSSGEGVPEDNMSAYMWYNIASSLGDEVAEYNKGGVAEEMTSSQIAEAEERSQQCLNSNYKDCD